jgi:hypothetical protein
MAVTINSKYVRNRRFVRHAHRFGTFLSQRATALASSATGKALTPVRTTNTKAEGLVTFGGQPSANDFLTISGVTFTFKGSLTEAKAAQTLTNDGTNITAADTVTIDGAVYTFKSSFTEAKAAQTLTNDGTNVTNADTVTIGSNVYTFQDTLTNVAGNVKIGASNTATMTNLFHAINASGGSAGTDYAAAGVAHPTVVATNPTGTTVVVTAKTVGTAGNAIVSTETSSHLSWGGTGTLAGGVASVAREVKVGSANTDSMTSLFEAINAGSNAGTDYSTATTAHGTVVATNPTGTTVVVTAKTVGTAGNALAVTEASSHLSWGGTGTLAGGVAAVANEVLIDDTSAHSRDNLMNAINGGTGVGTKYATGTVAQPVVVASASSGNLLLTAAQVVSLQRGKDVKLSKSGSNLTLSAAALDGPAWTATAHGFADGSGPYKVTNSGGALPAGTPTGEVWIHKIDTNTIAIGTSPEAVKNGNFIRTTDAGSGTHTLTRDVTAAGILGSMKKRNARTVAAATDIDAL